jgi:zinc transporter ZupT
MGQALVFGLIGSSALVIGGALGAYWRAPHQISGVLLAFASGTLISALAFELFPEAVHLGGLWPAGLGLIAGGLTFVVINTALDSWVARSAGDPHERGAGPLLGGRRGRLRSRGTADRAGAGGCRNPAGRPRGRWLRASGGGYPRRRARETGGATSRSTCLIMQHSS